MGGEGEFNGFRGREITAKRCRKTDQRSGDLSLRYRRLRDSAIAGADFVREDPVGLRALRGAPMEQATGAGGPRAFAQAGVAGLPRRPLTG